MRYYLISSAVVCVMLMASCASTLTWTEADTLNFPEDYLGTWSGPLQILKDGKVTHELEMNLTIAPIEKDRFSWTLTYIDGDKVDERPYELVVKDKEKGHFEVDELNSIILPMHRSGNRLISWFGVMGQQLQVSYVLFKKHIDFEISVSSAEQGSTSGGGQHLGDTIPEVGIYPLLVTQRGRMKRVKK